MSDEKREAAATSVERPEQGNRLYVVSPRSRPYIHEHIFGVKEYAYSWAEKHPDYFVRAFVEVPLSREDHAALIAEIEAELAPEFGFQVKANLADLLHRALAALRGAR